MPKLSDIGLKEVKLPSSQVTCFIGMSYGDFLKIEQEVNNSITIKTGKDAQNEISGKVISTEKEKLLLIALKKWDLEGDNGILPISIEHIGMLPVEDGEFLYKEISKLYKKETSEDAKKK
jgi:hypothetical protein